MIRARSIVVTLTLSALLVAASGCAKKKTTSPELRLPGNAFSSSGTGANAGGQWGANGAPGADAANGGLNSSLAGGSNSAWDAAGGLANNGNTSGVESAMQVGDMDMVHFDYDSAELKPETQQQLDGHAAWMTSNATVNVQVEGHCDERGTEEYNLSLGQRRADAVREYLVSKGVDAARVSTISYGKLRPLTFDQNEEANALNRRAMFLVYTPDQGTTTASTW